MRSGTTGRTQPPHRATGLVLGSIAALMIGVLSILFAPLAGAHGGPGEIEVVTPQPGSSISAGAPATYEVSLTFEGDGDAVADGTVTVVAIAGDGTRVGPVTLAATTTAGRYAGEVTFPTSGEWTVRFTSVEPDATVERVETVGDDATAAPNTAPSNAPGSAGPTSAAPGATAPGSTSTTSASVVPESSVTTVLDVPAASESDGAPWLLIVGIALVAALVVAGGVYYSRRPTP